ncbi:class II histone deacetylase [Leucobacter sp. CSA1]|uniref:Class II histone deacetylase n=1 Tax=Leucobacter chromiisoli TaxID=2796471 RepID=A0A934Q8Q4_9MICO|nr:class II histone deacetylase [Leucobacter chromiisoli]MBK0418612.1 class II histone deacetylase [Leucobacter chromiisoli]
MATGWVWNEAFNWHNTGNGAGWLPPGGYIEPFHSLESPESKGRLANLVEVSGLASQLLRIDASEAADEEILRVHTPEYLERLRELDQTGGDTGEVAHMGPGGLWIARLAAGAVSNAMRSVLRGDVDNAYALVRPAGHHAEADRGRGFCILANASIAIASAREEFDVGRVAVVDWDVHHGNGTQAAFWDDPETLTISIHQDRLYPTDSGLHAENGGPGAEGAALNVPLPPGCGDDAYVEAVERVVVPALRRFKPEVIHVASGFDASVWDPLGRMMVTSDGFRRLARLMKDLAEELCDGRLVFGHEGGYSAHYVPFCGLAVLEELAGLETPVEDPFLEGLLAYPQHRLQPHQDEAIREAAQLVARVPGR